MRIKSAANFLCLALALGLLSACASSPSARLYVLEPSQAARADAVRSSRPIVRVGPIALPEYLNRPQLVKRRDDSQLKVAEYDRWAEPLNEALLRVLSEEIGAALDSNGAYAFRTGQLYFDHAVIGNIKRFEANADGLVQLEVQWAIRRQNEEKTELSALGAVAYR
jgi:uncharacterized lipoprotein YmbA